MKFSSKVLKCGLSPMRKFHPYAVAAEAKGKKIYHLNIGQPDIFDGRDLRHDALMVAARQAVEFLDRHLLHTHLMPEAEVSQLRHQLPLGALADVELFDLFSGLDRFGHGTNPENKVAIHS